MQFDINQVLKVDPKMYRHFAVATIILTALFGFFADGENREAVAEEMDKHDQQVAARKAEEEKQSQKKPILVNRAGEGRDESADDSGGFGSATDRTSGKGFGTSMAWSSSSPGLRQGCGRALADRNVLAQMNDRQRDAYLARLDEMDCGGESAATAAPHQPTSAEISQLAAASAARSGSASVD